MMYGIILGEVAALLYLLKCQIKFNMNRVNLLVPQVSKMK